MAGRKRRTDRDQRRRTHGQNFLVDEQLVSRLLNTLEIEDDQLIVDIGAGAGGLTLPLARAGATVWAVEPDPRWARRLQTTVNDVGLAERVRVIESRCSGCGSPVSPIGWWPIHRSHSLPMAPQLRELLRPAWGHEQPGPIRAEVDQR